jgi:hypothetical protein
VGANVIESVEGRYEIEGVEFGTVYRWCPRHVVLVCDCGETLTLTSSETTCWCGMDHAAVVLDRLEARGLDGEAPHPWRYTGEEREDGELLLP